MPAEQLLLLLGRSVYEVGVVLKNYSTRDFTRATLAFRGIDRRSL
jgi:hypothetical protein